MTANPIVMVVDDDAGVRNAMRTLLKSVGIQSTLYSSVIPVIFMSGHGDIPMAVEAMQHGAFDFLQKPFRDQDLLDRIQRAIVKDAELRKSLGEHTRIRGHLESLTPREREVLDLMTQGKQNKAIAQVLDVSPRTVEIHRARVMEKMEAHSIAELVRMMLDLKQPVAGR
jgi:two-component system, LuxR family, response regulator FixJ